MPQRVQVVFDCRDPRALSEFYAGALHYKLQDPPAGFKSWQEAMKSWGVPETEWNSASAIVEPEGKGARVYFQKMETPKLGKNRVHIDMNLSGGPSLPKEKRKEQVRVEVGRLLKLGAKEQSEWDEPDDYWIVMTDPEGNEFCVQ